MEWSNEQVTELLKSNSELRTRVIQQDELILKMRNVLRYFARSNVGTFYQQNAAKEMAVNNKQIIYDRMNADGYTYNADYKSWILGCGGIEALDENAKEEAELS